jgi:hypothetical protein
MCYINYFHFQITIDVHVLVSCRDMFVFRHIQSNMEKLEAWNLKHVIWEKTVR